MARLPTAPVVAASLLGGYLVARETKIRPWAGHPGPVTLGRSPWAGH